jgi:hypothetical protein
VFSACLVSSLVLLWWRQDKLFIRCIFVCHINFLALKGLVVVPAAVLVVALVFCLLYECWCLWIERVWALLNSVFAFLPAVSVYDPRLNKVIVLWFRLPCLFCPLLCLLRRISLVK